jgi:chitin deacetylase
VLGHDIYNATVHDFAPFMLGKLKQLGYRAVPVGVCLNDPPEFWYRDPTTGGSIKAPTSTNSSNATAAASVPGKLTTGGAILKGAGFDRGVCCFLALDG